MIHHRPRQVLVDTNIVLLYFVGTFNRGLIPEFKRTRKFTVDDFEILTKFFTRFEDILTTPNILSEVNSLSGQLGEPVKTAFFTQFAQQIRILDERYVCSYDVSHAISFPNLGLTDSAILHLAEQENCLVLTDDFRLCGFLQKAGLTAINFNHLRFPRSWKNGF